MKKTLKESAVERNIKKILREKNIHFNESEHKPVYTCEKAAEVRGLKEEEAGIKCMLFEEEKGDLILVLNPGNERIDMRMIKKIGNFKELNLAKPEEIEKQAGISIGCIAPFGMKTAFRTFLNKRLLEKENLYFNPGAHTKTIRIKPEDLPILLNDCIFF